MKNKIKILLAVLVIMAILSAYDYGYIRGYDDVVDKLRNEVHELNGDNRSYTIFLIDNYSVMLNKSEKGAHININNPCIELQKATGTSMLKVFSDKELAIIDTCYNLSYLKEGDIIIFLKEWTFNDFVEHRIVDLDFEREWVQTKGDNNPVADDPIAFDRIYGKVIGHIDIDRD